MGVTGLWTVLQPSARPIKIETLNKKRLAVDASIWIYQFLKAVRDKEGNALRNSHVVGFFRRICKLLFIGIKPVFVFDGGAPALKRQTISGRKARREGRREDAVRTAGKLLALQMQRAAEEEERKRKEEEARARGTNHHVREEEPIPENLVYASEVLMTEEERKRNRTFRKSDAYHLPDLDVSISEMGGQNDPRIMSLEELERYARQFDRGEDINVYDFSKIDFDSPFFMSLPDSDRYNILNAARLRSRLRMGLSKEQLDTMFPDRMAFSRFQIERVRERNELTQRLMNINGMNDSLPGVSTGRVASSRNREYVLVKNDGVEGGWALGVVVNKDEGERNKPIDLDKPVPQPNQEEDQEWEDEEFEDVPIEGLNRLPKSLMKPSSRSSRNNIHPPRNTGQIQAKNHMQRPKRNVPQPDSLFVAEDEDEEDWENVDMNTHDDLEDQSTIQLRDEDDPDLQRAIAMSLEEERGGSEDEHDDFMEVFQQNQKKAEEPKPFFKGKGMSIAHAANARATKVMPRTFIEEDSEDDDMNLQAALAESRKSKRKSLPPPRIPAVKQPSPPRSEAAVTEQVKASPFDGPLPFEKLDLGSSLLGKKKMQKLSENTAGGFEKETDRKEKKQAVPLPPWFKGNIEEDLNAQKAIEAEDRRKDRKTDEELFQFQERPKSRIQDTQEAIDVDLSSQKEKEVIAIESDDDDDEKNEYAEMEDVIVHEPELRMGDIADKVRAEPPPSTETLPDNRTQNEPMPSVALAAKEKEGLPSPRTNILEESDGEPLEWEQSDQEEIHQTSRPTVDKIATPDNAQISSPSPEQEDEFEDVLIKEPTNTTEPTEPEEESLRPVDEMDITVIPASGLADDNLPLDLDVEAEAEYFDSDPEEDTILQQLAQEFEEHERFTSQLNNRVPLSSTTSTEQYNRDLKVLLSQQKRDRRDADEVTTSMIQECQHLLSLFGLPYITAPMEAEAQCAELVRLGLVDGIVTDDSDTFLFGGTRVYKNMFNQAKFVECYLSSDLEKDFGLTRSKLIALAQLLGSDYTEGLPGVGPVTALEIISEFGHLTAFRDWWADVQANRRPKADDQPIPFRRKFRKANATKLFLPTAFPDPRVEDAYLRPAVDDDAQPFRWGVPDLDALRRFLMASVGWSRERTDEVLVPVIRDMNRREREGTQSNITSFVGGTVGAGAFAPRKREVGKSKRLENALGRIRESAVRRDNGSGERRVRDGESGKLDEEIVMGYDQPTRVSRGKRAKKDAVSSADAEGSSEDGDDYEPPKKARKGARTGSSRGRGRGKTTKPS
ncbi:PIN domain-like protein [Patellaria atrata CBS 101060]|uniref:PIN domain-like protein n=1 Tax=Patellaria atrata CBS 101060 TaxID=1346257 RepID=A0A9P4VMV4_9PEZI|nr:PIN domain-like protein [Patellaria atrata CBS 101060]